MYMYIYIYICTYLYKCSITYTILTPGHLVASQFCMDLRQRSTSLIQSSRLISARPRSQAANYTTEWTHTAAQLLMALYQRGGARAERPCRAECEYI